MKKTITICLVFAFAVLVKTNTGGPGWALTNAPVTATTTESNCTNCHNNYSLQTSGSNFDRISLGNNFTGNGYIPDSTYTLVLGYRETGKSKFGFQLTCLEEKTYKAAGTFTNGDSRSQTGTSVVGGGTRYYIGHTSTGSARVTTDSTSWRFTWKAPSRNVGKVVFWVTLNVSNSSSGTSGDYVYAKSFAVSPSTLLPTVKAKITDANICSNTQLNFAADVTGSPGTYSWSFPSGTPSSSTSSTPRVTYNNAGNFLAILTVRNSKGPSANDTLRFTVKASPTVPVISPSTNQSICAGDSVRLSTSPASGVTYRWAPYGQTSQSFFTKDSGFYSVTVTGSNGCSRSSTTSIKVTVNPIPSIQIVSNLKNDSTCIGSSFALNLRKVKNPADSFSFVSANGPWSTDTSKNYVASSVGTGSYTAWVKSKSGCKSQSVKTIVAVAKSAAPTLSLGSKTLTSFLVKWSSVVGASGYEVSEDSGRTFKTPSSGSVGLEHQVVGMTAGKKREIRVKALVKGLCSETETATIVGETDTCSAINFNVQLSASKICLNGKSTLNITGLNGKKVNVRINGLAAGSDTSYIMMPQSTTAYSVELQDIDKADCGYSAPKTVTIEVEEVPVSTNLSGTPTYSTCSKTGTETLKMERIGGNSSNDSLFWMKNGVVANAGIASSFTFSVSNNDSVWMKVKSKFGCVKEGNKTKIKLVAVPDAAFTYQNNGTIYTFNAKDTNGTHQWLGPDGLQANGSKTSFDLTSKAGKNVTIYHKHTLNGCEGTDSVVISVQLQNLSSFGQNAWLRLYPNPATDQLHIQSSTAGFIQITNAEGRLVFEMFIDKSKTLNVIDLKTGVYTATFKGQNGYSRARFVILR
jgi:hypothetical protein